MTLFRDWPHRVHLSGRFNSRRFPNAPELDSRPSPSVAAVTTRFAGVSPLIPSQNTTGRGSSLAVFLFSVCVLTSAFGGLRLGVVSLSASVSCAVLAVSLLKIAQPDANAPASAVSIAAVSVFLVLLGLAARGALSVDIDAAQQSVVLLAFGAVLLLATQIRSDAVRVQVSLDRASTLLLVVLISSVVVRTLIGESGFWAAPRIIALGALPLLAWFSSGWNLSRRNQLLAAAASLLVIGTLSRTASAAALLICVVLRPHRSFSRRGSTLLRRVVGLSTLGFVIIELFQPLRQRFLVGDMTVQVGDVSINGSGRIAVWRLLSATLNDDLWFGHGFGSSRSVIRQVFPNIEHPHNEYLRILFEVGVVGLVVLCLLLAMALRVTRAPRGRSQTERQARFVSAARLQLVAFMITSVTDNSIVYPFMVLPLGLLLGLAIRFRQAEFGGYITDGARSEPQPQTLVPSFGERTRPASIAPQRPEPPSDEPRWGDCPRFG